MSDEFWRGFWVALPPTLVAAAAVLEARRTHKAVNSKLDKWLAVERRQGERDGKAEEKKNPTP